MKTDTSTNLMLVIFCLVLIGFVVFSNKVNVNIKAKQALIEKSTNTNH